MGGIFGKSFGDNETVTYDSSKDTTETSGEEGKSGGLNILAVSGLVFVAIAVFIGYRIVKFKRSPK